MEAVYRFFPECREICNALGLDPSRPDRIRFPACRRLPPRRGCDVDNCALAREGIAAHEIGKVTEPAEGLKVRIGDDVRDLPTFPRDELARWFGG